MDSRDLISVGNRYFNLVRSIWLPFAHCGRLIPFCTPFAYRPSALVIGTNHSYFSPQAIAHKGTSEDKLRLDDIGERLTLGVPNDPTYFIQESNRFVQGLREVCRRAQVKIDETWMGTNRCAVQTGADGLTAVRKCNPQQFSRCQQSMDRILIQLIHELEPANVLLIGNYAAELFYGIEPIMSKLKSVDHVVSPEMKIRVIPLPHPSRASFWEPAAVRLREHFRGSRPRHPE